MLPLSVSIALGFYFVNRSRICIFYHFNQPLNLPKNFLFDLQQFIYYATMHA